MRLRKRNGQSCTRNEEEMINRSGIIENRGGGGIFPVLFLAGGDASLEWERGMGGEGGSCGEMVFQSGQDADDGNPSLEPLVSGAEKLSSLFDAGLFLASGCFQHDHLQFSQTPSTLSPGTFQMLLLSRTSARPSGLISRL